MSASQIVIEEESGTYTSRRRPHPHNGYYAGDFWTDWRGAPTRASDIAPTHS